MTELKLPEPDTHCLADEGGRPIDVWSYSPELVRQIIEADRAQQSARHREELLAYEVTVSNLRAQREQAQPVAIVDDCDTGCFVEILQDVNVRMGDKLYLHPATPQAQPERKPERDRAEEMRAEFHEEMRRDAFGDRA